ncbi:response regulator [Larkinella terrae]|uniref:Response regulator n=1 Tax=Larkinella terrae TaxID=2025311 RepID=A0A7K0ECI5_9BACT|nr:response regulator [Larkinella terrae]MRS59680.1 response regulator [Larkinella terrae]
MVYIVDDGADYRFLVQQVFTLFLPQHPVRFFADGANLVDALNSLTRDVWPEVIVLDVDMPRLDGFQTLVHLKQHSDWQSVPVVMMTNRTDRDYQQESFRLGASAFVPKPMDLLGIKTVMTQLCERSGDFASLPRLNQPAA